jgi:exopolyphosphatase/guanosine-5'-triphosphate,3'-diphosphate pyrophosphatase
MSGKKISVIDLGTNTFHLLTVEVFGDGQWITLDRERVFVNLASDGISRISQAAIHRGLETMRRFRSRIDVYGSEHIIAVGTAALREATNAGHFLSQVFALTGIRVQVISGEREAYLITRGVQQALPEIDRPLLIMDIGGGSVELILLNNEHVVFAGSFQIGVAILYSAFHPDEPIHVDSLRQMDAFLKETLSEILELLLQYPDTVLVGASGTFEVVDAILHPHAGPDVPPFATAMPKAFEPIYREIISLNLEERLEHPDIPATRAQYIVVALHLITFILRHVSKDHFYISNFAMKEGLVADYLNF